MEPGEGSETARAFADVLENRFVLPDVGKRYAAMLRGKAAAGGYDKVADWKTMTEVLTADVQTVHPDGHLRVMAGKPTPPPPGAFADPTGGPKPIEEAKWLAPGVAYIRFTLFPGDPETVAATERFMREHVDANTIIVDLRTHSGGGLGEMDAMLPYLFEKPAALVHMDMRADVERAHGPIIGDGPTIRRIEAGPEVVRREHHVAPHASEARLRDARLFVLTSGRTASAAEHFALALKRTGRATLIGEATMGAGHFGGFVPVGRNFSAFVPSGRSFDPDTGQGWEGAGIKPNVEVPAESALVEALKLAGVEASEAATLSASVHPKGKMVRPSRAPAR